LETPHPLRIHHPVKKRRWGGVVCGWFCDNRKAVKPLSNKNKKAFLGF